MVWIDLVGNFFSAAKPLSGAERSNPDTSTPIHKNRNALIMKPPSHQSKTYLESGEKILPPIPPLLAFAHNL